MFNLLLLTFLFTWTTCLCSTTWIYILSSPRCVHVIVLPVRVETWQRWNRILTSGLRTGDMLKVSSGCLECSASVSFHHGNSSETQPDILPVHQQPWTGLTWLIAVSHGLPPVCLSFVIHWHCLSSFKFKNPFGKIWNFMIYFSSSILCPDCNLPFGKLWIAGTFCWLSSSGEYILLAPRKYQRGTSAAP